MKRIIILLVLILFFIPFVYAEERFIFFNQYNPSSTSFVYNNSGDTTTGDVASVFTYDKKTIFINCLTLGSTSILYQIEGRSVGEIDKWSVLRNGEIRSVSPDVAKNFVIDITELIDFIRVGLKVYSGDNSDSITIRGLFK